MGDRTHAAKPWMVPPGVPSHQFVAAEEVYHNQVKRGVMHYDDPRWEKDGYWSPGYMVRKGEAKKKESKASEEEKKEPKPFVPLPKDPVTPVPQTPANWGKEGRCDVAYVYHWFGCLIGVLCILLSPFFEIIPLFFLCCVWHWLKKYHVLQHGIADTHESLVSIALVIWLFIGILVAGASLLLLTPLVVIILAPGVVMLQFLWHLNSHYG